MAAILKADTRNLMTILDQFLASCDADQADLNANVECKTSENVLVLWVSVVSVVHFDQVMWRDSSRAANCWRCDVQRRMSIGDGEIGECYGIFFFVRDLRCCRASDETRRRTACLIWNGAEVHGLNPQEPANRAAMAANSEPRRNGKDHLGQLKILVALLPLPFRSASTRSLRTCVAWETRCARNLNAIDQLSDKNILLLKKKRVSWVRIILHPICNMSMSAIKNLIR